MNPEDEAILFQETFDIMFQSSMDMIFLIDKDNKVIDTNIQACRYLGLTLDDIKDSDIKKYVKERKLMQEFLADTKEKGTQIERLTFYIKDQKELTFHVSSTLVSTNGLNYSVLMCRDIQDILDSANQRQFFFDLFQHDLLNSLHAEVGYLDMYKRLLRQDAMEPETAVQMLDKMREITVRSIYLIQNANINLLLQEDRPLSNQKLEDMFNQTTRYLNNFFPRRIKVEVTHKDNIVLLGDEYMYRVFVNLIVRMLEYTDEKIEAELYVTKAAYDKVKIKIHFEGIVLPTDAKNDILEMAVFDRKKLDVAVTQNMLERYGMKLSIQNVKRLGEIVATRMTLTVPIFEWDVQKAEDKKEK